MSGSAQQFGASGSDCGVADKIHQCMMQSTLDPAWLEYFDSGARKLAVGKGVESVQLNSLGKFSYLPQ